jgi:MFS family permease
MRDASLIRLPRRALFGFIVVTLIAALAAMLAGWFPSRRWAGVVLSLYFAVFLATLALAYVLSGNTLMYHYRTGTVQREHSPGTFWSIVAAHLLLVVVFAIVGGGLWVGMRGGTA